jgi:uncharacterized protein YjiS (DUF1127 family)
MLLPARRRKRRLRRASAHGPTREGAPRRGPDEPLAGWAPHRGRRNRAEHGRNTRNPIRRTAKSARNAALVTPTGRTQREEHTTMMAIDMDLTTGGDRRSARIRNAFSAWLGRARDRRALAALDERTLKDIGLSRYDVAAEIARRPWWP